MNELKGRGVEDVLIAIVDGLKGFPEAITAVFPQAQVQTCVVHLIRHSLAFVSYKDRKAVISADGTTSDLLFSGVEANTDTFVGTLGVTYRLIDQDSRWLDLVAGGRVWSIDNDVTFKAGLLPELQSGVSESWIDPVVGLRGSIDLGSGFFAAAYADVGSGASDLTWQIYGGIGYRFNGRFLGQIGYRHLSVDYENDDFIWDVEMSGPIIGLTIRF